MKINALMMDVSDNVVTCVETIQAGQKVIYRQDGKLCEITAGEMIPSCHKIALQSLEKGQEVRKYGELIGRTSLAIEKGKWVSHHNIKSVPRDYKSEYIQ